MSKKTAVQPLSDNTRKLIIIIAIALVAVIVLSIALALILKTDVKTPAVDTTDPSTSSTLPIKNGDFLYTSSDDTGYPRNAVNWTKYTYNDGSTFETINSDEKSVMGIVDVSKDNWDSVVVPDLTDAGISVSNPGVHSDELDDNNVYMIYNRESTTASILSESASVASGASIKITVWLNTAQLAEGSQAVIMIQKSTVSAKEENWYAYNFQIEKKDGWQSYDFYIFNREASTKYVRVSVGLGNVYFAEEGATAGKGAEGVLFVDDITYETKTADDYRQQVDDPKNIEVAKVSKPYEVIENEDITDESKYFELEAALDTEKVEPFAASDEYVAEAGYSPFTNRDDFKDGKSGFVIYKVTQNGTGVTALRLNANGDNKGDHNGVTLQSSVINKDHYHISFWIRLDKQDGHAATKANVYVQKWVDADNDWKDIENGSFARITTSQEIDTDANCGWVKYDIYLKPATAQKEEISILFVLGSKDPYTEDNENSGVIPRGSLYVTSPAYETISYKDYNSASSGSLKLNLNGASTTRASITNGSFSDVNNLGNEPTSWTPVFAGDNAIYKDGKGNALDKMENKTLRDKSRTAGSGVVRSDSSTDDAQKNALQITTDGTNFGYISSDISLSSRTVYVFSVLAKVDSGSKPFIYLIDNSKDRDKAVIARVEGTQGDLEGVFDYPRNYGGDDASDGWVRYYIVFVTGDDSVTVRLALFNGKIDPKNESEVSTTKSTVLYDNALLTAIGTYSFVEDEDNKDATEYLTKFTATSRYQKALDALTTEDHDAIDLESDAIKALGEKGFVQPDEDEWSEMRQIPADSDDDGDTDEDDTTPTTPREVDWGLLMSVISSVLLVAALLIVFVIKLFQRKRPRAV